MAEHGHVILKGSERVHMPGARALGAADQHEWISVTLKVRRKQALPDVAGRPVQVISRAAYAAEYCAAACDLDKVAAGLEAFGLSIASTDATTRTVQATGAVAAMEAAFKVRLFRYAHPRGDYRGRLGPVFIPAELEGLVEGVFGLDSRCVVRRRRCGSRLLQAAPGAGAQRPWFYPAELAQVYGFPGGDGAGQAIGLIEFGGGYFPDDLASFCQAAQLPVPTVVPISVDQAPTNRRDGAEGEVMLDVQVVAGVCPQATIPIYFSSFTEKGWVDVLDAAIHDRTQSPQVLAISWGDAEDHASWTAQALTQINETLKEAALLGVTVCVASGDDGSDDQVGDAHAHVDFPASSPYVLAVGGTTCRRQGAGVSEVSWKDGDGLRKDGGGSSGGGVSVVFARPQWQNVAVHSINPGAISGRCVPDVAANASAHTGYFVVVDGATGISGGTSAAAPLWAALIARINASLGVGKHVGYLTPLLYQLTGSGKALGALGCNDIVDGNNNTAAVGGYSALPGYDAVTGWGSPQGTELLSLLRAIV